MPAPEPRTLIKTLSHFAEREYKEKRPKSVKVYRIKSKSVLTRGILPSFQIKQTGPIAFIIVVDYSEDLRIYQFSRQGLLVSGENIEPSSKLLKQLNKSTSLVFQLPKKEPLMHPKDASGHLQEIVQFHYNHINQALNTKIKLPFTFIVASPRALVLTSRDFGCQLIGNKYEIPSKGLTSPLIDIIIVKTLFTHYISSLITLNKKQLKPVIEDIAFILSYIYFGFRDSNILLNALKKDCIYVLNNISLNFTLEAKRFLQKNKPTIKIPSLPTKELYSIFSNIHSLLSILKKYQLSLDAEDLFYFIKEMVTILQEITQPSRTHHLYIKDLWGVSEVAYFYHQVFKKSIDMSKEEGKYERDLLKSIFQIPQSHFTRDNIITILAYFAETLNKVSPYQIIGDIEALISDYVIHFMAEQLFNYELQDYYDKINKIWDVKLIIHNLFFYPLHNVFFIYSWNPTHRLELSSNIKESILNEFFEDHIETLHFKVNTLGTVYFTVKSSFQNPLFPNSTHSITKTVKSFLSE